MTAENIPPLLELDVGEYDKRFISQETLDKVMRIIYERRPDFFRRSAERDKSWIADPTQDEEAWVHDEFTKDFLRFLRYELAKEIDLPDTTTQGCVFHHARAVARLMYGLPSQRVM